VSRVACLQLLLRGLRDLLGWCTGLLGLLTGLGELDLLDLLGVILRRFLAGSDDSSSEPADE
jgi:hypothetical protein